MLWKPLHYHIINMIVKMLIKLYIKILIHITNIVKMNDNIYHLKYLFNTPKDGKQQKQNNLY